MSKLWTKAWPLFAVIVAVALLTWTLAARSANAAEWNCNSKEVLATYSDLVGAEFVHWGNPGFGLSSYQEYQNLSDDQLVNLLKTSITHSMFEEKGDNAIEQQWLEKMRQIGIAGYKAFRSVFVVRSAVPVDINKDLKRYTCQPSIEFDEQALQAAAMQVVMVHLFSAQDNNSLSLTMVAAASAKRGDGRGYAIIFNVALPQMVPQTVINLKNLVPPTFTVQPEDPMSSANSKYIVTLGGR
jgi:hypothetical protein